MNKLSKREQNKYATVAQSVEQLIRNQQVAGSSPASSSRKTRFDKGQVAFFVYIEKAEASATDFSANSHNKYLRSLAYTVSFKSSSKRFAVSLQRLPNAAYSTP